MEHHRLSKTNRFRQKSLINFSKIRRSNGLSNFCTNLFEINRDVSDVNSPTTSSISVIQSPTSHHTTKCFKTSANSLRKGVKRSSEANSFFIPNKIMKTCPNANLRMSGIKEEFPTELPSIEQEDKFKHEYFSLPVQSEREQNDLVNSTKTALSKFLNINPLWSPVEIQQHFYKTCESYDIPSIIYPVSISTLDYKSWLENFKKFIFSMKHQAKHGIWPPINDIFYKEFYSYSATQFQDYLDAVNIDIIDVKLSNNT